jgi:hypothetical protein
MRSHAKRDWLARLTVLGLLAGGTPQAAWILVDDFSGGTGNWTVSQTGSGTVGIVTNTLTSGPNPGPVGTVAKLDMSSTTSNKYAFMTSKSTYSRGDAAVLKVAFDLGYTQTPTNAYNGYGHYLSLVTSSTATTNSCLAGHVGGMGTDVTNRYAFYMKAGTGATTFSGTSARQLTGTWYHYELSMTASQTILNAFTWTSSNPADYLAASPVWSQSSATGIGTGNYYLRLTNLQPFLDTATQSRDIMYADNVYYLVPEPAALALLGLGALGLAGRRRRR